MSEQPTPGVPEAIAERRPEALTPERIETVLGEFRAWLHDAAARGMMGEAPEPAAEAIDLHTLLAQFTALRHEVNLQTKAVRAQQEQNAQTLSALQQAVETSKATTSPANQPDEDAARAQLKTLIEVHDALALASREAKRARESVLPSLDELAEWAEPAKAELEKPAGLLARLFGISDALAAREREIAALRHRLERARQVAGHVRGVLDSLVTGYTMSVQRLERALHQHELEPIPCAGENFDPERMEALEIVSNSGRSSGEVIDEVRRGYLWRGRVFRFAQVRVAKN